MYYMIVAPSILSADWTKLPAELVVCKTIGITHIHFDVMDGHFVPPITFGPKFIADLRPRSSLFYDVHLMIETPEKQFSSFIEAGADAITFHIESTNFSYRLIQQLRESNSKIKIGIALNPQTPVGQIYPFIHLVDIVLLMSVEPGFGGQKFIPDIIKKVSQLHNHRKHNTENNLSYRISIDGGVNLQTAPDLVAAGADILVMGNAFFSSKHKDSLISNIESMK